jgi:hypothetical protein
MTVADAMTEATRAKVGETLEVRTDYLLDVDHSAHPTAPSAATPRECERVAVVGLGFVTARLVPVTTTSHRLAGS